MSEREELEARFQEVYPDCCGEVDKGGTCCAPACTRGDVLKALSRLPKGNGELVEAVRTAKKFAEIIATGRDEGDNYRASEIVNICERALSDSEGVSTSVKPKTAAEITAIIREWLDSDDPTHWGKFETDLDAALEGVATSGGDAGLVECLKAALEACSIYSGSCGDVIYDYGYDGPTVDQLLDKARAALPTPPALDTQRAERATNGDHHDEG